MHSQEDSVHYNETIIISELERRFYLYLIGGGYEKLFYTFDGPQSDEVESDNINMSRIRLEVEVTQRQRQEQVRANCADPEYKGILDYMLKARIANRLENQEDLITTCPQLADLRNILKGFGKDSHFDEALFEKIEQVPWLTAQVKRFANNPEFEGLIDIKNRADVRSILLAIGYPLFIWLIPRFISEILHASMHHSLRPLVARLRQFGRLTSGAIATLAIEERAAFDEKWKIYLLAGVNVVPLFIIVNLVNSELSKLLEEQKETLSNEPEDQADKLSVIDHYEFSSDALRDFLSLEEILKPHILENIGFEYFDPLPYLLGYADHSTPMSHIFFKGRAYAFYRQLFKTGRIHPHETAVFLRKHDIDKSTLYKLNERDLTTVASHIRLYHSLMANEESNNKGNTV